MYTNLINTLLNSNARQAIKYLSPKHTIKAARRAYKGKFSRRQVEILVTDGPPNYREREFIKLLKKAEEPFPVKKIQLRGIK